METILRGLTNLGVALLPSAYCALFLFWRYGNEQPPRTFDVGPLSGIQVVLLAVSILLGILIYYFHRGLFHHFIWAVQKRVYGIPQYQFHLRVCNDLGINGPVRDKVGVSQACLFLMQVDEPEPYRTSTVAFNTGSHILYLTALTFSMACAHDFMACHPLWGVLWLALAFLFFAMALSYDRLADYREIVFLTQRKTKYSEIVRNLNEFQECLLRH